MKFLWKTSTFGSLFVLFISTNAALAQVAVVSVNSTSSGPLKSSAPSKIVAGVQSSAATASSPTRFR